MKQRKKTVLLASAVLFALVLVFAGCSAGPWRPHEPPPAPISVRLHFTHWHNNLNRQQYSTANQISIQWYHGGHRMRGVDNHRIERSNSALGPWYTISFTRNSLFTDTGLSPNTTWFYRVINICINGLESIPSVVVSGTTFPLAPIGVTATPLSGAIQISWTAATGVTHHRIEFSDGSWPTRWFPLTGAGSVTGTSFTHSNLGANVRRYYRVIAINSAGHESAPSATVSATSLP